MSETSWIDLFWEVLWHGYGHPQAVASGHKPVASIWPVLSRNGGERQKKSQAWWRHAWSGVGVGIGGGPDVGATSTMVEAEGKPCSSAARGRRAVAYGRGGRGCARWSESPAAVVVLVLPLAVVVVAYGAVVLAVVACVAYGVWGCEGREEGP
ncbi:hypothetical protein B0H14DRAFT_2638193 [Mycena olivaceomarginata]|nr:hypothetical protein B0H14DRAFT_2638193 [Mycena olivaceomarginata]